MNKKVAILVDWENLKNTLIDCRKELNRSKNDISVFSASKLLKLIKRIINPDEEIFRIYVYLSEPLREAKCGKEIYCIEQDEHGRNLYLETINFINDLKAEDYVLIRKGKTVFRGFNRNNKPIFIQKQVDLLIGLDMYKLSSDKIVDRIILLSLDTDLIPAIKVARDNGVQIVLPEYILKYRPLSLMLKENADIIRKIDIVKLFKEIYL
ncbi:NYN domain-containing protein [Methanocaldococcus indicus]|uniref:NYN domain-containing protein n=1 Tax=Methanocaldococcus indicus TaxID=213231 RepID=UPI003C6D685C